MKRWLNLCLAAVTAAVLLVACGDSDDSVDSPSPSGPVTGTPPAPSTVAEIAAGAGFSVLVAAAEKAGLGGVLSDPAATLTVFAPTDVAFGNLANALGYADAGAMVAALDAATLAKVLNYHMLPTRLDAAALVAAGATSRQATLYNFPGSTAATLALSTTAGVQITDAAMNQASVTRADVAAGNSVIHVIDKVLVPPGVLTLVQMARSNASFSVLVEALVAANLAGTFSGAGPFTVFAPTNDAFAATLAELGVSKDALLADSGLGDILNYHAVAGALQANDVLALPKPATVATVQGETFSVDAALQITDGRGRVASLLASDVVASNGVIHAIDKVLLPPVPPPPPDTSI